MKQEKKPKFLQKTNANDKLLARLIKKKKTLVTYFRNKSEDVAIYPMDIKKIVKLF